MIIVNPILFHFNFRFTENMTFPSIAKNQENMIFTLSVFYENAVFHAAWDSVNLLIVQFEIYVMWLSLSEP